MGGGRAQFFWHLFYQVAGPHILTSIHDKCILFGHFEHQNYQHFNHNYHSHHLRGVVGGDEVIWAMPERKHFFMRASLRAYKLFNLSAVWLHLTRPICTTKFSKGFLK